MSSAHAAAAAAPAASTVTQTQQMKDSVAHVLGQRSKSRFFVRCAMSQRGSIQHSVSEMPHRFFAVLVCIRQFSHLFVSGRSPCDCMHPHPISSPIRVTACAAYQSEWYAVLACAHAFMPRDHHECLTEPCSSQSFITIHAFHSSGQVVEPRNHRCRTALLSLLAGAPCDLYLCICI